MAKQATGPLKMALVARADAYFPIDLSVPHAVHGYHGEAFAGLMFLIRSALGTLVKLLLSQVPGVLAPQLAIGVHGSTVSQTSAIAMIGRRVRILADKGWPALRKSRHPALNQRSST